MTAGAGGGGTGGSGAAPTGAAPDDAPSEGEVDEGCCSVPEPGSRVGSVASLPAETPVVFAFAPEVPSCCFGAAVCASESWVAPTMARVTAVDRRMLLELGIGRSIVPLRLLVEILDNILPVED